MLDNSKRWFLLVLAATWLLAVLVLATHQDIRVFGIAPLTVPLIAAFRQLYRYYFPPSNADYELQKLKIQSKSKRTRHL